MTSGVFMLVVITGRNEVVAKVMFLHVCVILFTGEVSPGSPARQGEPPTLGQVGRTPPGQAGRTTLSRSRQGEPPPQAGMQTPVYGL